MITFVLVLPHTVQHHVYCKLSTYSNIGSLIMEPFSTLLDLVLSVLVGGKLDLIRYIFFIIYAVSLSSLVPLLNLNFCLWTQQYPCLRDLQLVQGIQLVFQAYKSVSLNQLVFFTHQCYIREVRVVHQVNVGSGFKKTTFPFIMTFQKKVDFDVGKMVKHV